MNAAHEGPARRLRSRRLALAAVTALTMVLGLLPGVAGAQEDPRIGLSPAGLYDAGEAASNMELLHTSPKPEGFIDPNNIGNLSFANSDMAMQGDKAFVGNFRGWQRYDISDPAAPVLETTVLCPGGQGDVSVHGDLLFMSVEAALGRIDCGTQGTSGTPDPARFRGVRIFDISDPDNPVQLPGVQSCRGSHTHTLVTDPTDDENVYIYISGTSGVRPATELAGCGITGANPGSSQFRIDIIKVPLDAPETASIVNSPYVFTDPVTGAINGFGSVNHCHDITVYPEIGRAAGACQGRGLLWDITDPANPVRLDVVADSNFSYWHSATFSNDGSKVVFTDEWGGGTGARCRPGDPMNFGANGIYDVVETEGGPRMEFASYYKLPVVQTPQENCVSHNGSLVPVPNRDIMVQAWYQGGTTVFDFTDSANPVEIAFFDRAPLSATSLITGGHWSSYWHNGTIYAPEIARGFDVLDLLASDHLSENELDVARSVSAYETNPQHQEGYGFDATFVLGRAHVDQLARDGAITAALEGKVRHALDMAEEWIQNPRQRGPALSHLDRAMGLIEWQIGVIAKGKPQGDADRLAALYVTIQDLYDSL